MFKRIPVTLAMIGFAAGALSAQTSLAPDTFKVNYYSNAHTGDLPDGTVRITNVGTQIGSKADPSGYLEAGIFVLGAGSATGRMLFFPAESRCVAHSQYQ